MTVRVRIETTGDSEDWDILPGGKAIRIDGGGHLIVSDVNGHPAAIFPPGSWHAAEVDDGVARIRVPQ